MYELVRSLYPICRSITGEGVRQTLAQLRELIPLEVHQVPSGTAVFDWTVPREWNIRDAWVKNAAGERVIDFQRHTLHVVSYSVPVRARMTLTQLRPHLHTLPDQPELIPYRTSYYQEDWGLCLPHRQLEQLPEGEYEVCIDSTLQDGHLNWGECLLPGELEDEVLLSCHVCHPSLCDDNLSGIAVATFLARELAAAPRRYSYRFLFVPGTIGSIAWLHRNQARTHRIRHGLVLTCLGDSAGFTYKRSRRGEAEIDRALEHVLAHCGAPSELVDFSPYGYDERQYNSPGFDLPVGCLMRSQHGCFPEYHTSADDLDFVRPESLAQSLALLRSVVRVLEDNRCYRSLNPFCEPQLGRRGLYAGLGGTQIRTLQMAMLWVMNQSDGTHSLLDIAQRAGLPFDTVAEAARLLVRGELITATAPPA
ncbi:DUF4910 domain-containing protein [Ramlibacter rhizophilus]|uniref:DUF4910 domain-containing protein n=2 Tax=Ramlibacter rhizophilus TaxID=1781167 RepID=A0A4Z0BE88_9BURK|nr:DUF4910 domain-containing protein [Ramlibacter rhizophilus]